MISNVNFIDQLRSRCTKGNPPLAGALRQGGQRQDQARPCAMRRCSAHMAGDGEGESTHNIELRAKRLIGRSILTSCLARRPGPHQDYRYFQLQHQPHQKAPCWRPHQACCRYVCISPSSLVSANTACRPGRAVPSVPASRAR